MQPLLRPVGAFADSVINTPGDIIMYFELTNRSESLIFTNTDGLRISDTTNSEDGGKHKCKSAADSNEKHTSSWGLMTQFTWSHVQRRWRHLPPRIHTQNYRSLLLFGFISVVTIEVIFLTKKNKTKTSRTSSLTQRYKEFNMNRNHKK